MTSDASTTPASGAPAQPARRRWLVIVLAVAILAAVAGTGAVVYLQTRPDRPVSAPPADGGRYDTGPELVAALGAHGLQCTGYAGIDNPIGALSRGTCQIDGHDTIVSVYATEAEALAQADRMNQFLGGLAPVDVVVGLDWTVNCHDRATAERVAAAIGGHIVHAGP